MVENNFVIRKATPDDCGKLLELILLLAEYEKMADQVVATEESMREWIFERGKAEALLLETDGRAVGYAIYFYNFSTFMGRAGLYLEDIFVLPEYRKRGYGKALLKYIATLAVKEGCGRVEWTCLNWNTPSIGFYKSLGAKPQDEWVLFRLTGEELAEFGKKE